MKRLGRVLGNLLAVALTVASMQAMAETQLGGRDFNHMTTGFPLSGGHATAACETCHVGGVFKGTPRNCDGCHAVGKRVVATPKSNSHIVTDAPCESCHFNTATWLGARYSHGTARPGQCNTCHNGRIAQGKPANHKVTTASCDQCHRTGAWLPATWNHSGSGYVGVACAFCHNGTTATGKTASHTGQKGTFACDDCHRQTGWHPAVYNHRGVAPGTCKTCHATPNTHVSKGYTDSCDTCHTFAAGWGFSHRGVRSGCATCHASKAVKKHGAVSPGSKYYNCEQCHSTSTWDR